MAQLADFTFLTGLHGSVATILICALLLADEAGVPMPFAPNEVLLLLAGLLIASGAISAFVFLPLALLALLGGSFTAYSWARRLGEAQLAGLADRLHARRAYDRAVRRISGASPRQIMVTRLIPGIRIYASLCAGAAGISPGRFMRGNVPALIVWLGVMVSLGFAVGVPAVHFLSAVEDLLLSGLLFIVLGFLCFRTLRRVPRRTTSPSPGPFHGIARRDRYALAIAVDAGLIATITAGLDRITRYVLHFRIPLIPERTIFEPLTLLAAIALFYLFASRRSRSGETAGERLFDVSYIHPRMAAPHPEAPAPDGGSPDERPAAGTAGTRSR